MNHKYQLAVILYNQSPPENLSCLCILGLGHKADERKPQNEDKLKWENVSWQ